jgi:hypothetical protein
MKMNLLQKVGCLVVVCLAVAEGQSIAEPLADTYHLRVYGSISAKEIPAKGDYHQVRLTAADTARAKIVFSKIVSDFTTLPTVKAGKIAGKSGLTVLSFEGGRRILPVFHEGDTFVDVYLFDTSAQLDDFLHSADSVVDGGLVLTGRQHPYFLDLWDRHCMGFWYTLMKDKDFTDDEDFAFFRAHELAVNTVGGYNAIAARCDHDDLGFKMNRWNDVSNFVYDEHPEAATTGDPDMTAKASYYGNVPFAENPLEKAQLTELQDYLKQFANDEHFMSITDPHGETGPGEESFLGFQERGIFSQKDFVHYLRDLQQMSLSQVGKRWYGDASRFKSWDEVMIPRERDFFGWVDGSQDLSGTWKLHLLSRDDGEKQQVYSTTYDDSAWFTFRQPGMQELTEKVGGKDGAWLRYSFTADPALLKSGKPVYLTICPFNYASYQNPCTIYLNGAKIMDLSFGHGAEWGQLDVATTLKAGSNVLAIYSPQGAVRGPRFLTPKKAEEFPTSDPLLNARLYDVREWVTDCVARANARSMEYIRGVDTVRPIKMMAFYSMIDIMMPYLQKLGGYPHCTGEGAFIRPWFKRYGYLRGIPDSSEPSEPSKTMNGLRRDFFTMTMEGMNAHDYFLHLHDITRNPEMKAWYEQNVEYFKLMGRFDLKKPEVAVARSWRVDRVVIPWADSPGDTGYQNDLGRGDIEQTHFSYVYTSERELQDHLVNDYKVIIDDNFHTLNPEDVDNLEAWVKAGGTLVLNQRSGRNTYLQANSWPIARLTGCTATIRPQGGQVKFEGDPVILKAYAGKSFANTNNLYDWQKHAYFTDCIALEPKGSDVSVVARYDDGKPAIVLHPLGKGKVVVLGSAFYRDSHDLKGYFVGSADQTIFYKHLLSDLGVSPVVESDQDPLWAERFISNNGSTEMLVLGNQSDTDPLQNGSAVWDLGFAPKRVFDPVTGADLPVKIDGTKVTITGVNLVPYELRYYAVERSNQDAVEPLAHWLFRQSQLWGAVSTGHEVEPQDKRFPVQALGNWMVKQFDTEADARQALAAGSTDSSWQSLRKADWASNGLRTGKNLWSVSQIKINVNAKWLSDLRGVEVLWGLGFHTDQQMALNGTPIGDKGKYDQAQVLAAFKPGENVLSVLCGANGAGNGGMIADFVLCPVPGAGAKTLDLNTGWTVYPTDITSQLVDLPANGDWLMARQTVKIPDQYRDCQVWIEAPGVSQVSTNGALRYPSNNYGARYHRSSLLVNITPDIHFGQDNEIALGSGNWGDGIKVGPMKLQSVRLLFIPN